VDYSGKVVLVTGAAGGIGQVLARHFGALGATLAVTDRNESVMAFADTLGEEGITAAAAVADISDNEQAVAAIRSLRAALGPAAVLVNNAGYSNAATLKMTTPDTWSEDIGGNLNGAYHCTTAVLDDMKAAGTGVIVNISSVNGLMGYGDPAYSAAKAGLINYTKSLAMEYGRFGIRANVICPGTVRTPAWNHRVERQPEILEQLQVWYPLGRVVDPIDVARAAAFLASSDADAITGAVLPVDCGLSAGNLVMTRQITLEDI